MSFPFILRLIDIFKIKIKIFENFELLVKPLKNIIQDPADVYTEKFQKIVIEKRPFRSYGFLPLVEKLIGINNQLFYYKDEEDKISIRNEFGINIEANIANLNPNMHQIYLKMMEVVKKEQYYLKGLLKPTLIEISQRKDYKEDWKNNLEHFENFLVLLQVDLKRFEVLLHELDKGGYLDSSLELREKNRSRVKANLINAIQIETKSGDFSHSKYWVRHSIDRGWFDKEELMMLNNLILSIESKDIGKLRLLIKTKLFKEIFHKEEIEFFNGIAGKLREERESGINSTQLASNLMAEAESLKQLNELAKEIEAPQNVIEQIAEETEKVDEAIDLIEEAAPEVEKSFQLKKFKKSKFRRLRERFRIVRRKYKKGYKNKNEALKEGFRVLKESINLRKRITEYLKSSRLSKIISKLEKELNEIRRLISDADAKTNKFAKNPELVHRLNQLRIELTSMFIDAADAIDMIKGPNETEVIATRRQKASLFPDLWSELIKGNNDNNVNSFINQLINSLSKRREQIEREIKSLGRSLISRRGFLKGAGTAAIVAGIGTAAMLNKKWLMEHLNYLNVKVIKPLPDSSLTIGKPIEELEAKAEAPTGEVFDIDEFVDFSWHIRQENTDWVKIHDEKKGESKEIPADKFSPGPAELAVVMKDKKGLKKQAKIEIKLKNIDIANQELQVIGVNPSALGISVYDFYRLVYSDFDDIRNPIAYGELPKKTEEEIKNGIKLRDQLETKYDSYFYKANIAKIAMNNWYPILGGKDQVKRESFVPKAHEALDIFAQEGSLVYSPFNGIVIANGDFWRGKYDKDLVYYSGGLTPKAGNAIVIYNPDEQGYMWIAHFQEGLSVKTGDTVTRGQILGKVGNSGSALKPGHGKHVHVAYKLESKKGGLAYRTLEGINFYDRLYSTKKELIASNFNILLIGSDLMLGRRNIGERGDSLTFISTDTINKAIRVVSVPRDTYAFFSNKRKYDKINHALAFGGWQLQKSVVEEFLNVKVNKVIFLDIQNATGILNVIRKEFGNDVIKEIFGRIGLVNTIGFTYDTIRDFISNRNMPEAAVGRGKHHAIILRGCIELCIHYYRDPRKKDVFFNEQHISSLLKMVKYTDLTAQEFISLVNEWAKNDCSIQVYVIPGKEQKINKTSYWVPESIPGNQDYLTKVIGYRKSRVG